MPDDAAFYREYLRHGGAGLGNKESGIVVSGAGRTRRLLYVLNPTKFSACEYLVHFHEKRGDKVPTQCVFLRFSELQVRVDGVVATPRHRDAVFVAVRVYASRVCMSRRRRSTQVIVFSDDVFALLAYARALERPAIYGATKESERTSSTRFFQI